MSRRQSRICDHWIGR